MKWRKEREQAVEEIESRHESNRDPIAKLTWKQKDLSAHCLIKYNYKFIYKENYYLKNLT